jgi:hypothetical protein
MVTTGVLLEVRAESLNVIYTSFDFKGLMVSPLLRTLFVPTRSAALRYKPSCCFVCNFKPDCLDPPTQRSMCEDWS